MRRLRRRRRLRRHRRLRGRRRRRRWLRLHARRVGGPRRDRRRRIAGRRLHAHHGLRRRRRHRARRRRRDRRRGRRRVNPLRLGLRQHAHDRDAVGERAAVVLAPELETFRVQARLDGLVHVLHERGRQKPLAVQAVVRGREADLGARLVGLAHVDRQVDLVPVVARLELAPVDERHHRVHDLLVVRDDGEDVVRRGLDDEVRRLVRREELVGHALDLDGEFVPRVRRRADGRGGRREGRRGDGDVEDEAVDHHRRVVARAAAVRLLLDVVGQPLDAHFPRLRAAAKIEVVVAVLEAKRLDLLRALLHRALRDLLGDLELGLAEELGQDVLAALPAVAAVVEEREVVLERAFGARRVARRRRRWRRERRGHRRRRYARRLRVVAVNSEVLLVLVVQLPP
mmetsp:Transcript_16362/g.49254  ORF Transcript_16362/g.49254 Transcript_16362/m.49254 type:complete len:399 (-) Transcript_16362:310-1506(-)